MKSLRIVLLVVVVAAVIIGWILWPSHPVGITLPGKPSVSSFTFPFWGWAIVAELLILADRFYIGLFSIFTERRELIVTSPLRILLLIILTSALSFGMVYTIHWWSGPDMQSQNNGFITVTAFNSQVITVPVDGRVSAESDGPQQLTNLNTRQVITSVAAVPRIGWYKSDYFVIPDQQITAGKYQVSGNGPMSDNPGGGAIDAVRFSGVPYVLATRSSSNFWGLAVGAVFVWGLMSFVITHFTSIREGTDEELEAIRTQKYEESKRR